MRTAIDYAREAKDLREKLREVRADRDALRAALAQQVPEPTPAMCRAAVEYVNGPDVYSNVPREALAIEEGIYASVWRAMKAVAPPAAQQVPAVPGWRRATPEEMREVDAALGIVELPPIRVSNEMHARLSECASRINMPIQAFTRRVLDALMNPSNQTVPDGWQAVPVEPTEEMLDAAGCCYTDNTTGSLRGIWEDMLAAAPLPTPADNAEVTGLGRNRSKDD